MSTSNAMFTDGEAYERLMGRWSKLVGDQFIQWLAPAPNLDWLDVGCGNGAFSEEVANKAKPKSIVGLDPSPAQIEFAKSRTGLNAAKFQIGDAHALPFADASFDVSVMALVIAFLQDPAKALAEQMRVTKSGGQIATYMWDLPAGVPVSPIYKALAKLGHPAPLPPNPGIAKIEALQNLWQNAGLTAVASKVFNITVTFENFDDFWQTNSIPIGPQGKFIEALPIAIKEQLIAELKTQLPKLADGKIVYASFANAVKGVKP